MASSDGGVTFRRRRGGEVPDDFSESALMAGALHRSGFVQEVVHRFWLGRKAGLLGSELLLILLAMWSSGRLGQRAVSAVRSVYGRALAAAFGIRSWPSQSALSRALRSTLLARVRPFVAWLLMETLPLGALERDGSAYHHDTRGKRWRVVDGDGRVLAFRQRALPTDEALPEGKRQVDDLAAPGYPGRKRGEVQVHRMVVQDAGTGRYLGVRMAPGNGEHHEELIWAAQLAAEQSRALEHPLELTLLRLDGKASGAPSVAAAFHAGIALVTRWKDYRLLDTPEIRKTLQDACWTVVPDSGSGPRRTATELGTIGLEDIPRPEPKDSAGCRPVEVRIVVTRYRVSREEARGCGVTIDDWQYELFATTVGADDWPAAELVELYYGRSGQENRFLQIDAELGKLRLITTHLPGMELLVAAALFLSNWRLQQGAAAARWCPSPEVSQPPRTVEIMLPDPTILPLGPEAPAREQTITGSAKQDVAPAEPPADLGASGISGQAASTEALTEVPSPAMAILPAESEVRVPELEPVAKVAASVNDELPSPSNESPASLPAAPTVPGNMALSNEPRLQQAAVQPTSRASDRSRSLMAVLLPLLWLYKDLILKHHPGWSWRIEPGAFFCPSGEQALPICATRTRHGRDLLVLRVTPAACRDCSIRSGCTKSEAWSWGRDLRLKFLTSPGAAAPSLCCPRQAGIASAAASPRAQPDTPRPLRPSPAASRWSPPTHAAPGPHQASAPSLVPAHLRRCASEILGGCRVTVDLPSMRRSLPRRPWSALTAAERQHRRHTYGQRIDARHRPVARIDVAYPAGVKPAEIRRIIGADLRRQPSASIGESG